MYLNRRVFFFLSEYFQFLEVKFSMYLNRRVFVLFYGQKPGYLRIQGRLRSIDQTLLSDKKRFR